MKKITHSILKDFSQVRLYIDEIKEILAILKEEGFTDIIIETNIAQYKHNELCNIDINEILEKIYVYNPNYISIDFNQSYGKGGTIYSASDNAISSGILQKIESILSKSSRNVFATYTKYTLVTPIYLVGIFMLSFLVNNGNISSFEFWFIFLIIVFLYILSAILDSGVFFRKNIVIFSKKEKYPNFWSRKKDEIILLVFSNTLTVLLTVILTK